MLSRAARYSVRRQQSLLGRRALHGTASNSSILAPSSVSGAIDSTNRSSALPQVNGKDVVPSPAAASSAALGNRSFSAGSEDSLSFQGNVLRYEWADQASGVLLVTFDNQNEKMNTLSQNTMEEVEKVLNELESNNNVHSVVLATAKKDNWIAGADINMLSAAKTQEELSALSQKGQEMVERLENVWKTHKKPVVAAIHGSCLGGGLEVALAASYRIATTSPKTKLGVPEVQLGLLPGAGGTQRLPKTVGIQQALTMATTGKNIKPDRAKKMGLVHATIDPNGLQSAAVQAAKDLENGTLKAPQRKLNTTDKLLEGNPIGRAVLFNRARSEVEKKSKGYVAPMAIFDCIKTGVESGYSAGIKKEREEFGRLGMTSISDALRHIYFSQTATKKNPYGEPQHDTKQVAVLGAGLMGAGIAQVSSVNANCNVVLKDKFNNGLVRGEQQIRKSLDQLVKKKSISSFERDQYMGKIIGLSDDAITWGGYGAKPTPGSSDFTSAIHQHLSSTDLVIEAVFEELGVKHKVIEEIEPYLPDHGVFATNTSAIPIADIAKGAKRPGRVLGMHYFSPVDKMPLLEVITHEGTDKDAAAQAVNLGYKQGKTVIVVKDVPGFYVNRCLGPFMTESMALVQEGVSAEKIDSATKNFGFPVGTITLTDEVGIDVAQHVQSFLSDKLGPRMQGGDPAVLKAFVDKGFLGRKSGKGFFTYESKDKKVNPEASELLKPYIHGNGEGIDETIIQERMACRFLNEAIRCLEDGIISGPGDGDIGAVFGIGFPPFYGGPFKYIDIVGADKILGQMQRYEDSHGEQFSPPQMLKDMAKQQKKFHP